MYGIIAGTTEDDDIKYCPKCGREISTFCGDGTAKCECGYHFGVVEVVECEET